MKKLIAYITPNLPESSFTKELILAWAESGVDLVELGIPFSDPIADGKVIQRANELSLKNGTDFKLVLNIAKEVGDFVPIYLMGYFNSFFNFGFDKLNFDFIKGYIIPDMPKEEREIFAKSLNLVDFVAPLDSKERVKEIISLSPSFIYLVAFAGITGQKKDEKLSQVIAWIREVSKKEIFLGFGVDKSNAKKKAKEVDGVIVGTAFIKILLDEKKSNLEKLKEMVELARIIKEEINS